MSPLGQKLVRELWARKGALGSLAAITAMGIAFFLGFSSVMLDLERSRDDFYRTCRLADFSLGVKRAPAWAIEGLTSVAGVREVRGRVNLGVRLELPGSDEALLGTALSIPARPQGIIDGVVLRRGTYFTGRGDQEALVNDAFARARGLQPGDRVDVVIQGGVYSVLLVGMVLSPEYVFAIPPGGLAPDPARSPVLFMPERFLQQAGALDGAYNEVVGLLGSPPAALETMERRLEPYGVMLTVPRREQTSVHYLENELTELRVNSIMLPGICLGVVTMVLQVVMGRLVASQRTAVGTLRALGYSRFELWSHYLGYGLAVGVVGGGLGVWLGSWLQSAFLGLYRQYFELPDLDPRLHPNLVGLALLLGLAGAAAGAALGIRKPLRLMPADAMRPAPPERGQAIVLERIRPLWRRLGFRTRLVLRSVFRNPYRSLVTLGTAFIATTLLVETLCMLGAIEFLVDFTFRRTSHQDLTVGLREPIHAMSGRAEVAGLPSTALVETQLSVLCDLSRGAAKKRVGVTGMLPGSQLQTPLDVHGNRLAIPPTGLLLSRKLAQILDVRPGQTVRVKPLLARRQEAEVPVTGVADTYLGLSAYAHRDYLSRLLGEEQVANGLLLDTYHSEPGRAVLRELRERPLVLGLDRRDLTIRKLEETLNQAIGRSLVFLVLFSGALAFGSVLNTALVSLTERQREIGTFRVLGYGVAEVWLIFAGESLLVNATGILLGLPGGVAFAHVIARAYDTELFRLPVVVDPGLLVVAALLMMFFVALAQIAVFRLMVGLPWLDVLKVRD